MPLKLKYSEKSGSLLILRLSAMGDVVMLMPLVATLRKEWPQWKITWVVSRSFSELIKGIEGVEVIEVDKPRNLKGYYNFWKKFKDRRFDVLLAPQANLRANFMIPLIRAKVKLGYDSKRAHGLQSLFCHQQIAHSRQHILDSFFAFAETMGIKERHLQWNFNDSEFDEWAKSLAPDKRPLVIVTPASSKEERNWPLGRLIEVMKEVQKLYKAQIVLTGGTSELEKKYSVEIKKQIETVDLIGKTSLLELVALIRRADFLIAPDTGSVHIARAVNTPVVGLYAVAPSSLSGPYGQMDYVVDKYPEALKNSTGLGPNEAPWGKRIHGGNAMKLIDVEEVLEKVSLLMKSKGTPFQGRPQT